MSLTRPLPAGVAPRPLLELAQGLTDVYGKLQPAKAGSKPSEGDRVEALRQQPGPIGDAARTLMFELEKAIRWLRDALNDLEPWLVQFDVLLAYAGVVAAALEGSKEAAVGLASLSKHMVGINDRPDALFASLERQRALPEFKAAFDQAENAALIVPPPEDVAVALAAIAPLLVENPAPGARSLPSLRRAITRTP